MSKNAELDALVTYGRYNEHARRCGIDMEDKHAIPVFQAVGRILAVDVIHPEYSTLAVEVGTRLTKRMCFDIQAAGCDYVIVEWNSHK